MDSIIIYFDSGSALQVGDDAPTAAVRDGFASVPGLLDVVVECGLAEPRDVAGTVVACELVLEALVARRKISRSDSGLYGRAPDLPRRRRPRDDEPFEA